MTSNSTTSQAIRPSLKTRMIIGAAIGLGVISFFVFSANGGNPEWGRFWMIRPLLVVQAAGAIGGLVSYFMAYLAELYGWNKILISIFSLLVFVFGIWMGIVLGLVGTMWH